VNELPLSKRRQLAGFNKEETERKKTTKEKDALMKLVLVGLYIVHSKSEEVKKLLEKSTDHIRNKKSSPQLRYKPSNLQLLDELTEHSQKTDSGLYTDLREKDLAEWLSDFDCLFIDHK